MVRSLGELGERSRRPKARSRVVAPEYRVCRYCDRRLYRGMGIRQDDGYRCRRACTLVPFRWTPPSR